MLTHLDLFAGIGGLSKAAERVGGIRTTQFVELDPDAQRILPSRFGEIPIHADIRDFYPRIGEFDIYSLGFPCTGTSIAGNGSGLNHPESSLWFEALRCIADGKPNFVIIENPPLSPVLKSQPVCFWKGRIKFLDVNYQPKLPARQSHCLVYWGNNPGRFKEVFDSYGVVQLPPNLTSFELLGDIENSPSNSPSKNISPSKDSPSKKREWGFGNGYIHWRKITRGGKDYPQAYYHWKDNGKKRTKYIPKNFGVLFIKYFN